MGQRGWWGCLHTFQSSVLCDTTYLIEVDNLILSYFLMRIPYLGTLRLSLLHRFSVNTQKNERLPLIAGFLLPRDEIWKDVKLIVSNKCKKGHCSSMNTLHFNPDKWITGLASKKAWFYAIFSWGDIMWNWTYERNMFFHKVKSTLQYPPIIEAWGRHRDCNCSKGLKQGCYTGLQNIFQGQAKVFPR